MRTPRIALTGTFDVANFGDLLFPLIAEHELRRRLGGVDVVPYSYRELAGECWPYPVRALERLPDDLPTLVLVVVGGGDLIRFDKRVARGYGSRSRVLHYPTGYWLMPTLCAVAAGVPVAWNAVGVVGPVPAWACELTDLAAGAADYVTVRDHLSLDALSAATQASVRVVPDSAFGIRALLSPERSAGLEQLLSDAGVSKEYVVVQPSPLLAPRRDAIARAVEEAWAAALDVLELPASPVHGDGPGVLDLAEGVCRPSSWPDPIVLAEALARSEAVIAQSLHFSIVAVACGVPVFRYPSDERSKYESVEQLPAVHLWADAEGLAGLVARKTGRSLEPGPVVAERVAELEAHWDAIAGLVRQPRVPRLQAYARAIGLLAAAMELAAGDGTGADAASFEARLAEATDELSDARGQLEAERRARVLAEDDVARIHATKTWRLTAPLRLVFGRLRR